MKPTKVLRALALDREPRTYERLREAMNEQTIRRALASGDLVRLVADQYCLALHSESWIMRSQAAVEWAGPGAALTGIAALAAWEYVPNAIDLIHVAVPAGGHRSGPEWIKVRSLTMPFQTAIWDPGTEMTMPELALVLGYGAVPPQRRASFVHGAVHNGLISPSAALDLAKTLTRVPAKRELVTRLGRVMAGAESYLEERGMDTVFYGEECRELIFQHRVRVRGEGFRIDAFHPQSMTAFELDGDGSHASPPDRLRDIRRDAVLATAGIATVRLSRASVLESPEWCHEVVLETMESRANRWWVA